MSRLRAPTMIDVARLAGVSTMTVSRALRPDGSASEATRAKIREAADALGYVLDSAAAGLSSRKSGFIAITIPSMNNANFADTVRGLTEAVADKGLDVLMGYTDYRTAKEEQLIEAFLRRRPEAMVVTGGVHTERARRLLSSSGIPVVETWDLPDDPIDHVVGFSNAEAGRMMARYFIDRGYERIGFIGSQDGRDTRGADRRAGFFDTLEEHGLSTDMVLATGHPPVTMADGADTINHLLDRYPDTQAVMSVSDLSAFGALVACQRRGLQVPDDIVMAGFGAYDISSSCAPTITTIDVGAHQIGVRTGELIVDLLGQDPLDTQSRRIEMPLRFLERESTRQAASVNHADVPKATLGWPTP